MSIDEIAAKINPHTPWTVWRSLVAAVEVETATLDAMICPAHRATFTAFSAEGFRLERGAIKVIVTRSGVGTIGWSRIVEHGVETMPEKISGHLDLIGSGYALHGRAFSGIKEAALFLLGQLTD